MDMQMAEREARWGARTQQDSHEFLITLLTVLQSECDRNTRKPQYRELAGRGSEAEQAREAAEYARLWSDSVVDDVFGGLLQSTIQCQVCALYACKGGIHTAMVSASCCGSVWHWPRQANVLCNCAGGFEVKVK
jgi:ubiquitin C-terminal hydrolase